MAMKRELVCPHCEGRKIWHLPTAEPLHEILTWASFNGRKGVGKVERFMCASCGYIEHYGSDFAELSEDSGVRLIDNEPNAGLR